jgi:hypothetical protein
MLQPQAPVGIMPHAVLMLSTWVEIPQVRAWSPRLPPFRFQIQPQILPEDNQLSPLCYGSISLLQRLMGLRAH